MKLVVVIQRVRDCNVSSPSRQKPSRQVGSGPACVIVRRGMEPGAASMQAVLLSPEICIVVVSRINSGTREEKPTRSMQRKAAVLKAIRRADRIVQRAVVMILEAIFEQVFYSFSHGFRRGHSQRQALLELRKQYRKLNIKWIVDADVSGFFDNIAHDLLREFIKQRVKDGGILRLIGKWLNAGVLEAGERRTRRRARRKAE